MNELLPWLYDHVEPVALDIAGRAAHLEPADEQRGYLVDVSREIVESGRYRSALAANGLNGRLTATLRWFEILSEHLEPYVTGALRADDLIAHGGGPLWVAFQAQEPICAAWADGVAAAVRGRVRDARVLELGAGTGGTTRLLADALRGASEFVVSDVDQRFLDRIVADLPGVAATTALVDIDDPDPALGTFDLIYATNCVHVSKDVQAALRGLRAMVRPGGALVLGEGSHYAPDVPSPLSLVLSLFEGWWDAPLTPPRARPGFLLAEQWLEGLERAGFDVATAEMWADGRRRFGGVYWGRVLDGHA